MRTAVEIEIASPPDRVFAALADPERWLGGLVSAEDLADGGRAVGARSREVVVEQGQRLPVTTEITAFERDRRLDLALSSPYFDGDVSYRLDATDGGTRLRFRGETSLSPLVGPFALYWEQAIDRKFRDDLGRLKSGLEGD